MEVLFLLLDLVNCLKNSQVFHLLIEPVFGDCNHYSCSDWTLRDHFLRCFVLLFPNDSSAGKHYEMQRGTFFLNMEYMNIEEVTNVISAGQCHTIRVCMYL